MSYLIPIWFVDAGIVIEILLAFIALTTAWYSLKMCKNVPQRSVRLLAMAYGALGLAYGFLAAYNLLTTGGNPYAPESFFPFARFFAPMVTFAFVIISLLGITLLLYLVLKSPSKKIFWLLFLGSVLAVFLSRDTLFSFFFFSSLYLAFIATYFFNNYLKNKKPHTLMIAVAFILLVISRVDFLFSIYHPLFYVFAHLFELVAFSLILANMLYIRRLCKNEKRSTTNPA